MGQAKTRKLALVAQREAGEKVEIPLGRRSARRLSALLYIAEGADAVAAVAKQAAEATAGKAAELRAKYNEAIYGIIEAHDLDTTGAQIQHKDDEDKIVVSFDKTADEKKPAPPLVANEGLDQVIADLDAAEGSAG